MRGCSQTTDLSRELPQGKCVPKALKGYIGRREQTSWKTQRKMVRCSGQGCYEDVEMQELEKVARG